MKKILFFYCFLFFATSSFLSAQGGIRLTSNVRMVCDGAVNVVINDGRLNNVSGTFTPGESTVKFVGTASTSNSLIQGKPFEFYNLMLHKNQNDVRLAAKMNINNELIFSRGDLDLNNTQVNLNTANGYNGVFVNEREGSHTYGAAANSKATKTITTTGPTQLSFDHLGILLVANGNFGKSSVDRRHAVMTLPSGNSIKKHWRVSTTSTPGAQNGTVSLYYFEDELNGLDETTLTIWSSTDNGLTWTDMGYASRNSTLNFVKITGVPNIEAWWTLGAETPLQGPSDDRLEAIADHTTTSEWRISPNPASDFTVAYFNSDKKESVIINLYSATGKWVLSTPFELQIGNNSCEIQLGDLSPGYYFLQIAGQPCIVVTKCF